MKIISATKRVDISLTYRELECLLNAVGYLADRGVGMGQEENKSYEYLFYKKFEKALIPILYKPKLINH